MVLPNPSSSPRRRRTSLMPELESKLAAYVLVTGAAGCLASAPQARAEIIYTPTQVRLGNGVAFIDLDQDGVNDFNLVNKSIEFFTYQDGLYRRRKVAVGGNVGASVILSGGHGSAAALTSGAAIGS